MIFNLICAITIATIIVESNSVPLQVEESELYGLEDINNRRFTSKREVNPASEFFDSIERGTQDPTRNSLSSAINRNMFKFIDSGIDALYDLADRTNQNIMKSIEPIRDASKANIMAAQVLGRLVLDAVGSVPMFGMRFMKNYMDESKEEKEESFEA